MRKSLYISLFFVLVGCASPERLNATMHEYIAYSERLYVGKLRAIPMESLCVEDRILIQRYIADFEESTYKCRGCNSTEDVAGQIHWMIYNPLALYRLVHRLFHNFPRVRSIAEQWIPTKYFVTEYGMRYAADPIVHMVFVDNLDIPALVNGQLLGIDLGVTLNARHCHEIGNYASKSVIYAVAIQFYELALDNAVVDGSISPYAVEGSLQAAILGKLIKFPPAIPDLRCWHETQTDPFWILHPLRVEELARNPDFILIRNAISPKRIADLKKFSIRKEQLDPVLPPPYNLERGWNDPISLFFRLFTNDNTLPPELPHLKYVEMFTGFSVKNTKKYKQKYFFNLDLPGGTYNVHVDNRHQGDNPIDYAKANIWDETVATLMIYNMSGIKFTLHLDEQLEIPEIGGETMFIPGNATVPLEIGTAVLWYTLRKDGSNAPALHGACTVLLGRKWTINKQIEYCDQFGFHQCPLNREEMFSFPRSFLRRKRHKKANKHL